MIRFLYLLLLLLPVNLAATNDSLTYITKNGKRFASYKIHTGEGLYAVGRRFNVDVKKIIAANPGAEKKLIVGQKVLVPLEDDTKTEEASKPIKTVEPIPAKTPKSSSGEDGVTYYIVKDKETLYRVSVNHHVTVDQIKKWNKFSKDEVTPGQRLIVGYSKPEKAEALPSEEKRMTVSKHSAEDGDYIDPKYVAEYNKSKKTKAKGKTEKKEIEEKGVAGWIDDGSIISNKSLALHKSAPIGTIIKLTNVMNGRHQYVKVVGVLPSDADKESVDIKVTKTIAQKLGVLDKYFRVQLQYAIETER